MPFCPLRQCGSKKPERLPSVTVSPVLGTDAAYFTRSFQPMTIRFLSLMIGFHFISCAIVVL